MEITSKTSILIHRLGVTSKQLVLPFLTATTVYFFPRNIVARSNGPCIVTQQFPIFNELADYG